MYKKTGRTLSFIMALALILSLFAGVMADNEGDEVGKGANLVEADTTDGNIGNLGTPLLSLFYNGDVKLDSSKASVKIDVMLDGQLMGSETKIIYRAGHTMTFTPAEGLILQQVTCNSGCTYDSKWFIANADSAVMTVYLTSEKNGEDPTVAIGDKASITYEYAKYNGVDVTVNVYVDAATTPAATETLTNVKRAANRMTVSIKEPTKFGLSEKGENGIVGEKCTYSGQVFTASTVNGPFTLNVYLKTIPETPKEEYVRLGITRVAPLLKLPRNVSKLVTISWDGAVKHTIIHKGWSNGFLKYYEVPKNKEITIQATMEGDFTSANWTCVNSFTQGILMNGSNATNCTSNPLKLIINEKNITSLDLFLKGAYADGSIPETGYTIEATWGEGGKISPEGTTVKKGADALFTITPNKDYEIEDVLVDGTSVGAVSSYTFKEVAANHTISATFKKTSTPPTEPELKEQSVYVYLEVAKNISGTVNGTGKYYTIGKIEVKLPEASKDYGKVKGEEQYETYKAAVTQALNSINRFKANKDIDLTNAQWYSLHTADGANDYIGNGTQAWHLDGRIVAPTTYTVTYTDGVDNEVVFADKEFKNLLAGGITPTIAAPTRDGYNFKGWNPEVAATVTGDATYTATWEKKTTPTDPEADGTFLVWSYEVEYNGIGDYGKWLSQYHATVPAGQDIQYNNNGTLAKLTIQAINDIVAAEKAELEKSYVDVRLKSANLQQEKLEDGTKAWDEKVTLAVTDGKVTAAQSSIDALKMRGGLETRLHLSWEITPKPEADTGKLTIGKTASFSDNGLNPTQFVFKYKITAEDKTLNGNYKYIWIEDEVRSEAYVKFTDGVGRIEVRAGGTKTIEGLPAGSYTVLETGVRASNYNPPVEGTYTINGIDFAGYTRATTANGTSGLTAVVSVENEKTASANFINTYTKNGTEPTVNHTLTYDANGGANAPAVVTKPEGTEVTLDGGSALTHANQGSTKVIFAGWTMTDTNEKVYTKNDTAPFYVTKVTLDTDKTVYAVWSLDSNNNDIPDVNETKYTITYMDGTSVLGTQQYLEGEAVTPIASPSKTDYRFDGWKPAVPSTMPKENLTVYAQWTYTGGGQPPVDPPIITTYAVNYNGNGNTAGTVPTDSNSYLYNANVIVKGNEGSLTRTDTVFMGFSKTVNAVLNSQAAENAAGIIGSFSITGNTTLYAVWAVDVNHNDIPDYKEEPTIPDEPTPGDPGDVKPGDDTEIPDDDTPLNPKPGNDGDNDIKDDDVPLGDLPKTGDSSNPWYLLAVMAAAMAGMVYMVFGKKARRG